MVGRNIQIQKWTLLGFGEVAATLFAASLQCTQNIQTSICLPTGRRPSEATRKRLNALELTATHEPGAVGDASVVISAVPPAAAVGVAEAVAAYLTPDCIYVDMNSIAGPTARQVGRIVEGHGARFVDAALMGPVPLLQLRVPIVLSGGGALDFHQLALSLGLNTSVLSSRAGDASSLKMLWSVMTKGSIALLAEALTAAHRLELLGPMRELLAQEYGNTGSEAMILRMLRSTTQSGARRLDEMGEVKKTLQSVSVPAWTVDTTLQWISELSAMTTARSAQSVEEVVRAISEELDSES
jgi:3-hydroxyisobutyrate dehydrogenase-like beta-hydroxyacid dehydrogenase